MQGVGQRACLVHRHAAGLGQQQRPQAQAHQLVVVDHQDAPRGDGNAGLAAQRRGMRRLWCGSGHGPGMVVRTTANLK
ncbi:hypothetical protein D3C86_1777420 [compost metagenome]